MATFYLKEGDTAPKLQASLKNPDGTAVDLTNANVDIRIAKARGGGNIESGNAFTTDANNGVIEYDLAQVNTDNDGRYRVEFEVTYIDGSVETFPNKGYHTLMVGRNMEV